MYLDFETSGLATGEIKYFVSNASANTQLREMLQVAFSRWHVENWQASRLVVCSGQTGSGIRCVRRSDLHQPHSPLVILADGDVLCADVMEKGEAAMARNGPEVDVSGLVESSQMRRYDESIAIRLPHR